MAKENQGQGPPKTTMSVYTNGFRWLWLPTRFAIYARDGFACLACGRLGSWKRGRGTWHDARPAALSIDHVVPRSQGGVSKPSNLVTLCVGCNSQKRDSPFLLWRPDLELALHQALSSPTDAELGRALCAELCPSVLEGRALRDRRRRETRRAA